MAVQCTGAILPLLGQGLAIAAIDFHPGFLGPVCCKLDGQFATEARTAVRKRNHAKPLRGTALTWLKTLKTLRPCKSAILTVCARSSDSFAREVFYPKGRVAGGVGVATADSSPRSRSDKGWMGDGGVPSTIRLHRRNGLGNRVDARCRVSLPLH